MPPNFTVYPKRHTHTHIFVYARFLTFTSLMMAQYDPKYVGDMVTVM
jgi:hypothetical protein